MSKLEQVGNVHLSFAPLWTSDIVGFTQELNSLNIVVVINTLPHHFQTQKEENQAHTDADC